jgi:SAM-dependent methyltransferase
LSRASRVAWDEEYRRAGIPSSYRDAPSAAVAWALESWPRLGCDQPRRALDVGCGTARNAAFLAGEGIRVTGFDSSPVAIEAGRKRVREAALDVDLLVHDLRTGLPVGDGEIDLVLDVFVYKHQTDPETRSRYRRELQRVLAEDGRVLMSLAEPDDGYYGSCPPSPEPGAAPHAILDPALGLTSALFSLDELTAELSDVLSLEMAWRKEQRGQMHGKEYTRRTLATLWRRAG